MGRIDSLLSAGFLMPFLMRRLLPAASLAVFVLIMNAQAVAQQRPATLQEFLAQYTGKEVLLLDTSSGEEQFTDGDSTSRYVVVLDEVHDGYLVVRRNSETDRRTFQYPLADIRRITYLFDGRPYPRIVIETF